MNIFDIMGPVMVGPSSSHTAGAVRIGLLTRALLGAQPVRARILLHGSFSATGKGHGTDRALAAGLLGMAPDDPRLPRSLALAEQAGLAVCFESVELPNAHPNTARLEVEGPDGRTLTVTAASLGGGRVRVTGIDGLEVSFSGELPTLIIRNQDRPGMVAEVSELLGRHGVNIATMQLRRDNRGGLAVMVLESDQPLPAGLVEELREADGVVSARYLCMEGEM